MTNAAQSGNRARVCDRCSTGFDSRFPGQSVGTEIMHSHCLAAEVEELRATNLRWAMRLGHIFGLRIIFDKRLRLATDGEVDEVTPDAILARLLETTREDYEIETRKAGVS